MLLTCPPPPAGAGALPPPPLAVHAPAPPPHVWHAPQPPPAPYPPTIGKQDGAAEADNQALQNVQVLLAGLDPASRLFLSSNLGKCSYQDCRRHVRVGQKKLPHSPAPASFRSKLRPAPASTSAAPAPLATAPGRGSAGRWQNLRHGMRQQQVSRTVFENAGIIQPQLTQPALQTRTKLQAHPKQLPTQDDVCGIEELILQAIAPAGSRAHYSSCLYPSTPLPFLPPGSAPS